MSGCFKSFSEHFMKISSIIIIAILLMYPTARILTWVWWGWIVEIPARFLVFFVISIIPVVLSAISRMYRNRNKNYLLWCLVSSGNIILNCLLIGIVLCMICEIVVIISYCLHIFYIIHNQWIFAVAVVGLTAIFAAIGLVNGLTVNIKKFQICSPLSQSLRIIQLSDVHIGSRSKRFLRNVVNKVNKLCADFVFITGDLADSSVVFDPSTSLGKSSDDRACEMGNFNSSSTDASANSNKNSLHSNSSGCCCNISYKSIPHHKRNHDLEPLHDLKARFGIFLVLGNHEYVSGQQGFLRTLKNYPNITVLNDEEVFVPVSPAANANTFHSAQSAHSVRSVQSSDSSSEVTSDSNSSSSSLLNSSTPSSSSSLSSSKEKPIEYVDIIGVDDCCSAAFRETVNKYLLLHQKLTEPPTVNSPFHFALSRKDDDVEAGGNEIASVNASDSLSSSSSSSSSPSSSPHLSMHPSNTLRIMLHHRPHRRTLNDTVRKMELDVILSGHTHGGQILIVMPFAKMLFHGVYGMYELVKDKAKSMRMMGKKGVEGGEEEEKGEGEEREKNGLKEACEGEEKGLLEEEVKTQNWNQSTENKEMNTCTLSSSSSSSSSSLTSLSKGSSRLNQLPFIYISPGTGTGSAPFRQVARNEITVFDFTGKDEVSKDV
ncbi:uncharacterized protein MONOS_4903 [Monocercomonoides exilis]|uniref:uncharacterized protein n=1 Tax=Monocercomonoides exilis TaxID=2049356 RepID=UPI00355AC218|nr:hypothetical protein MONOS_4903 [Monocercomonoides exilis]|eukprot:MONOS_4903.1-p1 / transcript=MONOS_4903.1 / gene=MONOS_4903 / organism=Monocercomonoides_exilis_PA203 / gene_product=unspecified product / transcript_product=unspecified product / location=Mono_scaffold00137:37090-39136(-) / protein_length=657 / sequence_SO=supercontig / SO=protein_coding / is_pseudo=false